MAEANGLAHCWPEKALETLVLLGPEAMARADRRTIEAGTPGIDLMERAGRAVVRALRGRWSPRPVLVLCGPGQNGGDGWVIARLLEAAGWPVTLASDWPARKVSGDASIAAERAGINPRPLSEVVPSAVPPLVVDALFGAGLSRPVEGSAAAALKACAAAGAEMVAVDLPSGLDGQTGAVKGMMVPAELTVTFHRLKPGHLIGEGPAACGALHCAEIGILPDHLDIDGVRNHPSLWRENLPYPPQAAHKYARGGVAIVGGPRHQSGAARLSAQATARAGAGAVTVFARPSAIDVYAAHLTAIMTQTDSALSDALATSKIGAVVIGPGLDQDDAARAQLNTVIEGGKPTVFDADALTLNEDDPAAFFARLPENAVLTPHEGEFARLFPGLSGDPVSRAVAAAERCGRVVLLKGATSVIAGPGQVPVLNAHATSWLATAGAGDTLAGIIAALMAQGLSPMAAAAAGAWLHGEAARQVGPGLTADDLSDAIPGAINAADQRSQMRIATRRVLL